MEIIFFILSSILVLRVLDKTKYRVAFIAHFVLFIMFFLIYLFSSEWEVLMNLGQALIGKQAYAFLHEAISEPVVLGTRLCYNAIMLGEIITALSLIFLATRALIKTKAKVLKYVQLRRSSFIQSSPIPMSERGNESLFSAFFGRNTYLVLSRLRN